MGQNSETDHINNKLELIAHFFLIYLGHCKLLADNANVKFKEISRKNIEFKVSINGAVACQRLQCKCCDVLEVVLMDMSGSQKCMVSVCSDEQPIRQEIFIYDRDLISNNEEVPFPLEKYRIGEFYSPKVDASLDAKFRLRSRTSSGKNQTGESEQSNMSSSGYAAVHQRLEKLKFGNPPLSASHRSAHRRNSISDMPRFDDEYEVNQSSGIPVTGEFGVPGLASGYGDRDLYPGGQKYPNLQDPASQFPSTQGRLRGQGGMIFDPSKSNPDDSWSDPLRGDPSSTGGPKPPFPGARFDDPFGRQNYQGGGGGGFI
ncbi:LAME_0H15500g1_1 [Lachancea meyersii CBS 8951]|uniref:LAME_0H15500g1_1 n=1 Tax=Lachancea meyersii CBS 8951 TaxID=1266667 RepID=A0A1G4KHT9_9SACH|nr:LAME_0H15500g1_1 [Lachancea meyersii CBS 8951]